MYNVEVGSAKVHFMVMTVFYKNTVEEKCSNHLYRETSNTLSSPSLYLKATQCSRPDSFLKNLPLSLNSTFLSHETL